MRLLLALLAIYHEVASFHPVPAFRRAGTFLESSTGNGGPPRNDGKNGPVGDFLDGFWKEESENMQKAREYMSDESLPISFNVEDSEDIRVEVNGVLDKTESPAEPETSDEPSEVSDGKQGELALSTAGSVVTQGQDFLEPPSEELLRNNPYMKVVSTLTPSELISKFTNTAHPRVQNAVRSTILGLIGSLPKMAFDTTTITTGQRLASLMFQLQMTGYLFKNAEYRLSLSQSLESISDMPAFGSGTQLTLPGVDDADDDDSVVDPLKGKIKGKIKIRYGVDEIDDSDTNETQCAPMELEVDAAAYMSELRTEVSQLRDELTLRRKEKEEAIRKDLLLYIRTLPEQQLRSLTGTVSQDVLLAMKGLVNVVMAGIGEGQIAADTVTEQSGEAMAQLCMWQLVVGYNLRELEVREEMKNSLFGRFSSLASDEGADLSEPGAFD
jgi:Protein of unknown function (DUF760)